MRLRLVVGHVDGGDAELVVQAADLEAHLLAQVRVEIGERLVEQQHRGLHHDGAGQGHPLLLAAATALRIAAAEVAHLHHVEDALYLDADLVLRHPPHLEAEGHVLGHRHVRPDRVALEDHRHVALLGRQRGARRGDAPAVHLDGALTRLEEARDHPEGGRLAAAGGAEQRDELAGLQGEREAVDRGHATEAAAHLGEDEAAHVAVLRSRKSRPTIRKPTSTSATVTTTRIRPMEERISKLPSSLLSKSSTDSTWVPVV